MIKGVEQYIRKLMGWCPNARAQEASRQISLENFDSDIPDRTKEENGDLKSPDWFWRVSNQILLFAIFLTFVYLLIYNQMGLNLFVLPGILPVLVYFTFRWKDRIQRFNAIAKKPIVRYVPKRSYLQGLLIIILLVPFMFLPYMFNPGTQLALFGFSIIWFFMWGFYFQLIYWEKKNHMKIYISRENSFEKTYAIGKKEGGL